MNRKFKTLKLVGASLVALTLVFTSCVGDTNSPGVEYMPDMYRSPAVETYVDYGQVLGKYDLDIVAAFESGLPPHGVIPTSSNSTNDLPYEHGAPVGFDKTHGLYGVAVDTNGYIDAAADVNPLAYTEQIGKDGKVLYKNFCIHCHGAKGEGDGSVVTNGGFPAPPSYTGALKDLPAGQIFYSMTYGKGLMGSHSSQLTKEERWKLVHYVETLQGKAKTEEVAVVVSDSTIVETMAEEVIETIVEKVVEHVAH